MSSRHRSSQHSRSLPLHPSQHSQPPSLHSAARSHHPSVLADAPARSHYSGSRHSAGTRPPPTRQRSYSAPSSSRHGSNVYSGAPAVYNPVLHRRRSNEVLPSDSISNVASLREEARERSMYPASMRSRPIGGSAAALPPLQHHGVIPGVHPSYQQQALPPASAPMQQSVHSGYGYGRPSIPVAVNHPTSGTQYIPAVPSTIYHTAAGVSYVPYHSMEVNGQRFTFAYPVKTSHAAPHLSPPASPHVPVHHQSQYTYGNVDPRSAYSKSAGTSPHRFVRNDFPRDDSSSEYSSMSSGSGRIGPRDPPQRDRGRSNGNGNGIMGKVRKMFGLGPGDSNDHSRAEVERERATLADAASVARSKSVHSGAARSRGRSLGRAEYEFRNPGKRTRNSSR